MYFKPSSMATPLSSDSAHPATVHRSWPTSRIKHVFKICTHHGAAMSASRIFLNNLIDKEVSHEYFEDEIKKPTVLADSKFSWITIPFHPCWCKCGVQRVLHAF